MKAVRSAPIRGRLKSTRSIPTSKLKKPNESIDSIRSVHLKLFEKFSAEREIKKLEDWYSVKENELPQECHHLLIKYFNGSLYNALKTLYPLHNWIPWNFSRVPRGYWSDLDNQRRFFDHVKTELNIMKPEDWYHVKSTQIHSHGGYGLLSSLYSNSLYNALSTLYPDLKLVPWMFDKAPFQYWRDKSNHKKYFDWLADQLHIKTWPDDWYKIRQVDMNPFGASSVLSHYNGSMSQALQSVYPEYDWKLWQFHRIPTKYMSSQDNMRKYIMDLSQKLSIMTLEDWYRVSHLQLRQMGAPYLASAIKLYRTLSAVYPEYSWELSKFKERNKTSAQRWLTIVVGQLFPSEEIIENYSHPELFFPDTKRKMRLDVFVPALFLAFEFNGPQHYRDIHYFGPSKQYNDRDEEKKKICRLHGINVIDVPYWWTGSKNSLAATVKKVKPDIKIGFEISDLEEPIPDSAPSPVQVATL